MHRFFMPSQDTLQDKMIMRDKREIHHIRDVLRLKEGDEVVIFNDKGIEFKAGIESVSSQSITFKVRQKAAAGRQQESKITVACALPKKSKMSDIVDKLTQLGVDRIIPMKTERVIVKLDKRKENLLMVRWQKIALNASKQSQRNSIPEIDRVRPLKEVLNEAGKFDLKLIPTLIDERKNIREVIVGSRAPKNILVLIGPEGDFSGEEVGMAVGSGFIPVSLGESVLRVDTAAIAVASYVRLALGALTI